MNDIEVRFNSGSLQLAGTLVQPGSAGKYPTAILIPGSGQVDRDENHRKLRINFFRETAGYLAGRGIATLRYDKRGVGVSEGDFWSAGFYDNVSDCAAALAHVRSLEQTRPDAVYLIGHSEGALIATRLAAEGAEVAGIVLIAGSARTGEEVLKWQAQQVVRGMTGFSGWLIRILRIDVLKAQRKQLDKIRNSTKDTYRVQLFARVNAKWMREFLAYDPAKDLPRIHAPVLAITGSKDIQTDPADLKRMAELVRSDFEYHEIPDLSHILRKEEGTPSLSTYRKQAQQPSDPQVLYVVSDWLLRRISASA